MALRVEVERLREENCELTAAAKKADTAGFSFPPGLDKNVRLGVFSPLGGQESFPRPAGVFCTPPGPPKCHIEQNSMFSRFPNLMRHFPYILPITSSFHSLFPLTISSHYLRPPLPQPLDPFSLFTLFPLPLSSFVSLLNSTKEKIPWKGEFTIRSDP